MAAGTVHDAIRAVRVRIRFYYKVKLALSDWLEDNEDRVADYQAAQAKIDTLLIPLEAELEALYEGELTIDPPTTADVQALKAKVQALTAKIAATQAMSDFMELITEAATTLRA